MTVLDHVLYGALWLSFGVGHTLLAGEGPGSPLGRVFGRAARFAYNVVATLHIAIVIGVGRFVLAPGGGGFTASPTVATAGLAVQALGLIIAVLALRAYDLGLFSGLRQLRAGAPDPSAPPEPLAVDGLHRWVRHPLYTGMFLILWGGATNAFGLATAVWASAYILIGAAYEERRLLRLYGDDYGAYRATVPAFIPWRGRAG